MTSEDTCCSIYPYFQVQEGKLDAFKNLCDRFVERTAKEEKCLYYGFSFNQLEVHCIMSSSIVIVNYTSAI